MQVEEIVPAGELDPEAIHVPGVYVHRVYKAASLQKRIEVCSVGPVSRTVAEADDFETPPLCRK